MQKEVAFLKNSSKVNQMFLNQYLISGVDILLDQHLVDKIREYKLFRIKWVYLISIKLLPVMWRLTVEYVLPLNERLSNCVWIRNDNFAAIRLISHKIRLQGRRNDCDALFGFLVNNHSFQISTLSCFGFNFFYYWRQVCIILVPLLG